MRQAISWISEHKNAMRVALLVLLVVAILGPWASTSDGVGPTAWCRAPNILLENGRCVRLVSGARVLSFMVGAFLSMSVGLFTGATILPDRARELFGVFLFLMPLLPLFTTLLLIRGRESRGLRIFHLLAWGLATVQSLLLAITSALPLGRLWGVWLYIGLAAITVTLEMFAFLARRKPSWG